MTLLRSIEDEYPLPSWHTHYTFTSVRGNQVHSSQHPHNHKHIPQTHTTDTYHKHLPQVLGLFTLTSLLCPIRHLQGQSSGPTPSSHSSTSPSPFPSPRKICSLSLQSKQTCNQIRPPLLQEAKHRYAPRAAISSKLPWKLLSHRHIQQHSSFSRHIATNVDIISRRNLWPISTNATGNSTPSSAQHYCTLGLGSQKHCHWQIETILFLETIPSLPPSPASTFPPLSHHRPIFLESSTSPRTTVRTSVEPSLNLRPDL